MEPIQRQISTSSCNKHPRQLEIIQAKITNNRVFLLNNLSGNLFTVSTWYPGIDFIKLREKYGDNFVETLLLHSVLFDLQSYMSVGTERIDISVFGEFVNDDLIHLWTECAVKNWAEWRYINHLPDQLPAKLMGIPSRSNSLPEVGKEGPLLLFSGGKDSLACAVGLEREGRDYHTFFVRQSKDGTMDLQSKLVSNVLAFTKFAGHHEASAFEDYIMSPIASWPGYDFKGIESGFAETVSFIFKSLLYVAAYGYDELILGNEAASDEGNFRWNVTGEIVNHQWTKSLDAERVIFEYINTHLIPGLRISSPLRNLKDREVLLLAAENPKALLQCHSCNVHKPWCRRCSKCCYVWLMYCAHLGFDFAYSVFQENLFEVVTNGKLFRQLYSDQKPFECVGKQVDVIDAFERCRSNEIAGTAVVEFSRRI